MAEFYKKLYKFVIDYLSEQNAKGENVLQSEIIGALDMVKMDFYLGQGLRKKFDSFLESNKDR